MKEKYEISGIMRAYILVITFTLCISGVVCGVIIAGNNTKALSEGERAATAGLQTDEQVTLTVAENQFSFDFTLYDRLEDIAASAPAPLGNLVFLYQSAKQLADELF